MANRPRNWMIKSYLKDGGKENPIPLRCMAALREMYGEKKIAKEKRETKQGIAKDAD